MWGHYTFGVTMSSGVDAVTCFDSSRRSLCLAMSRAAATSSHERDHAVMHALTDCGVRACRCLMHATRVLTGSCCRCAGTRAAGACGHAARTAARITVCLGAALFEHRTFARGERTPHTHTHSFDEAWRAGAPRAWRGVEHDAGNNLHKYTTSWSHGTPPTAAWKLALVDTLSRD